MFYFINILHWRQILGTLTVVATIFQFLSGAFACKQYIHNKTTGEASALPFLLCLLSCGVWYLYGDIKNDDLLIYVNLIGCLLMLSYVVVFYIFAFKIKELKRQILSCLLFSLLFYGYLSYEEDIFKQQNILGSVACGLTLLTIAAPLVKLYHVIRVRSTECLPFHMIVMTFVVSALWMLYGIVEDDSFLIMPNLIGGLLASCQLSLFMIYPNTPPKPASGKTLQA